MPLTEKGSEILSHMEKEYGTEKGKEVFYASRNKGTISGVDSEEEGFITIEPKEGEFLTLPVNDERKAEEPCAGVLLRVNGKFLLLLHAGEGRWVQPGGHLKKGETPEEGAVRELEEETGIRLSSPGDFIRTSEDGGVTYTTFLKDYNPGAEIDIDNESLDYGWFEPDNLPENTHPEVRRTIELIGGTELDIAKAIRSGELPSPQPFENILLYDMRITGTGTSFRPKNNEHVYRPPENFLTEDFVARCNGLPVIFEHPPGSALDTDEYRERAVGTIILPYIKGDEVRGVARIYDMDAARLMETTHTSTSPAVIFRPHDGNVTVDLDDGSHLLIEGIPSYLDHLAICTEGVWDKGGTPNGISTTGDTNMPETDKEVIRKGFEETTGGKEDKKDFGGREEKRDRKDGEEANIPAWADALVKKVDSLCERMDTFDKKDRKDRKDETEEEAHKKEGEDLRKAEEEHKKEDKKDRKDRKDESEEKKGEEEERRAGKELEKGREEEKKDSRMDSLAKENAILRDRLASVEVGVKSLSRELSHEEKDALAMAQSRADSLFLSLNEKLTAPLFGETPISYRKRLASRLQKYSPKLKDVKLDSISDAATFEILEREIYADAASASTSPAFLPEGKLIPEKFTDFAGRICTKYRGDIKAAFAPWVQRSVPFRVNTSLTSKK